MFIPTDLWVILTMRHKRPGYETCVNGNIHVVCGRLYFNFVNASDGAFLRNEWVLCVRNVCCNCSYITICLGIFYYYYFVIIILLFIIIIIIIIIFIIIIIIINIIIIILFFLNKFYI